MSAPELEKFLTVPQVAKRLKRDKSTVNRYIKKGYLRAERIAGRYLIDKAQLAEFRYPRPGNPNLR